MVSSSMALEYAAFASEKALLDGLKDRKETISKEDIEEAKQAIFRDAYESNGWKTDDH